MAERVDIVDSSLHQQLGLCLFEERFPWIGGDLQTLRDTFVDEDLPLDSGEAIEIAVPALKSGAADKGYLLSYLNLPAEISKTRALVLLLHGLGGSSRRNGLRRMACCLLNAGFGVLRLNLRGADPGRHLAGGTYAAACNSDLLPVLIRARQLCVSLGVQVKGNKGSLPLFGAGISLGGTILLNACLGIKNSVQIDKPVLDGLVCTSSPLDLRTCSSSIERLRNRLYQGWLLKRLVSQTLADPFGISDKEKDALFAITKNRNSQSIREFDSAITAPRWGYKDVDSYYLEASPFSQIIRDTTRLPPTLFLQSSDDPWVPSEGIKKFARSNAFHHDSRIKIILTLKGGHNGFHGVEGCWGDHLVERWFSKILSEHFS